MLPNKEYTFHVKVQCKLSQEWFEGDFVVKSVLTMAEQMDAAIRMDRYNGGSETLEKPFKVFNRTMAELEVRILKSPSWWKDSNGGWDLLDPDIVYSVFNQAIEGQKAWTEKLKVKADDAEKLAEKHPLKKAKEATG